MIGPRSGGKYRWWIHDTPAIRRLLRDVASQSAIRNHDPEFTPVPFREDDL